jgi:hypothetical protein
VPGTALCDIYGFQMSDERNSRGLTWDEEKAIHAELIAARDAEAEKERTRANAAVQAALSSYRWWGWTNIVNTVRLFIQRWRKYPWDQ